MGSHRFWAPVRTWIVTGVSCLQPALRQSASFLVLNFQICILADYIVLGNFKLLSRHFSHLGDEAEPKGLLYRMVL